MMSLTKDAAIKAMNFGKPVDKYWLSETAGISLRETSSMFYAWRTGEMYTCECGGSKGNLTYLVTAINEPTGSVASIIHLQDDISRMLNIEGKTVDEITKITGIAYGKLSKFISKLKLRSIPHFNATAAKKKVKRKPVSKFCSPIEHFKSDCDSIHALAFGIKL